MMIDADRLRKQVCSGRIESVYIIFTIQQRANQEGQQLSLKDEARRLQRDLDSELYKDADTKYLHRAGEIKVLLIYDTLV